MKKRLSDIVMVGFAGMEITLQLLAAHRDEAEKRFPRHFLAGEKILTGLCGTLQEEKLTTLLPAGEVLFPFGAGGVFDTLWKLAEQQNCGLLTDLMQIPCHTLTIELCELYDKNPYTEPAGAGGFLCTQEPELLLAALKEAGLPCACIGKLTGGRDRLVQNGEILRFLTPEG